MNKTCFKCKTSIDIKNFRKNGKICLICQKKKQAFKPLEKVDIEVKRKCLMCDKEFISTGNRKCNDCNSYYHDGSHSDVSCFVSCG